MCRPRWILAATFLALLILPSSPVLADWDVGDDFKMHFPQLPDPFGWDVSASNPGSPVADDWMCSETGYVSDIHIWGSWFMDNPDQTTIVNFHLSIWSDQPAAPPTIPFSHPDTLLWEYDFPAGTFIERIYGEPSPQGWFDPIFPYWEPENHGVTWQYNFFIPEGEAFIQEEGTIYWLVVEAILADGSPFWGWKTSLDHWNDDSVYLHPGEGWQELFDPLLPPEPENSLDQAFVITGEPLADWGDAPDQPYPTLAANNGANHTLGGALWLGALVDPEPDGQPDATATGDDNDGSNDDDGVTFNGALFPGVQTTITINVTAPCALSAWIDFNGDGDWLDQYETLWSGVPLSAGAHALPLGIPVSAAIGTTFARFRVTSSGFLTQTGNAPDGEVEDYKINIGEAPPIDYGDAPDPTFPTLHATNGARHILDGVTFLGAGVDAEPDGQPDGTATGDDLVGVPDDEDGVTFVSPLIPGFTAFVDVVASVPGVLDAWLDLNANGSWADPGEKIFLSTPLAPGLNNLTFYIPPGTPSGGFFARFRFSQAGGLWYAGQASDGEVEDYEVFIEAPLEDWGDAPDPFYPTLSASNGAVHTLVETVYLGGRVADGETDGQPDPTAMGDDNNDSDDEDGVVHSPGTIVPNTTVHVTVTASTPGFINAWVDFNADGDWTDAGEQVFTDAAVVAGANSLTFTTPAGVVTPTFARYRFDTTGGLLDIGPAADGEVEDYWFETPIFIDGFESGDTTEWSTTVGLAP
jgi:hypothetical protein